jgi:tyrosyl-tRNA synthetase
LEPKNRRLILKTFEDQLKEIKRGIVDIVTEADLLKKLKGSKPLKVKLGIDPTSTDIHLGHTVALNKLRQFQNLGHKAVLIMGDYTAMVGDPSGRMAERPHLDRSTILSNVSTYKQQAFKILDKDNLEVVFNGDWFGKMMFEDVLKLTSKFSIAQMLEHDYFDKRFKEGVPLYLHEMMYPIMQGYDSVMVKADIELGGTDQRFNVIAGRHMQKESGMEPQVGLFTPILMGLDGKNKMSKSLNNYIGLNDKPEDMFGKVMSIQDGLISQYFELLTDTPLEEISGMVLSMKTGKVNPRDIKVKLGYSIVKKYIGENEARYGQEHFEKAFSDREIPYDQHKHRWEFDKAEISVSEFFKAIDAAASNSDARRLVEQGGFYLNEKRVEDFKQLIKKSDMPFTFKVGKKRFGMFE